ncbi:reversion-inducing cysteine-rich protein with Kazal motifs-like [Tubulanus polymorphus]|uniref:reversion-inducing cysteine-rich protein with Kazal motifs-like n=1 Tax=Tubulanus polymorphus TaxID=672921 RepID=UPI003DA4027E
MNISFSVIALILCCQIVSGKNHGCCSLVVDNAACHQECEKTDTYGTARYQMEKLAKLAETCPSSMSDMWRCINNTFTAIQEIKVWNGRLCCDSILSEGCERNCRKAVSRPAAEASCDKGGSEEAFYQCLNRQEGSQCCNAGLTDQCRWICKTLILQEVTLTNEKQQALRDHCSSTSSTILTCIQNQTQITELENPKDMIPCCNSARTALCKKTCTEALQTKKTQDEVANSLILGCGHPNPLDPLWQCFLEKSAEQNSIQKPNPHDISGMDGAKLHCCNLAKSYSCKESCSKMYSKTWMNSWKEFKTNCQHVPSEEKLRACIEAVESPCKMGCDGLNYCNNFNHRPTELFRSCNAQADKEARNTAAMWQMGSIALPQIHVPALDVKKCKPELWKSITCALQVKPCHGSTQTNKLCKSSCMEVLQQCLDSKNIDKSETLCNMLAPVDDNAPCVSLYQYLSVSPDRSLERREVSHPCNPNPCTSSHVCLVNRRKCRHPSHCKPYICRPGCPVGGMSQMYVPKGNYVLTPVPSSVPGCYKLCKCGHSNKLNHCIDLPCQKTRSCLLKTTGFDKDHGSFFQVGCNHFICHDSKIIRSKRECAGVTRTQGTVSSSTVSGLPCKCPHQYAPVCSDNGRTYPSACIARCAGVSNAQFKFGECMDHNPCDSEPCKLGERCYARRQTCLSPNVKECRQYECIPVQSSMCNPHHHDPVCDTMGEEHSNLCVLISQGRQPAYRGHCRYHCNMATVVCGHNGETYPNECSALGSGTTVDYEGACKTVGQYYSTMGRYKCRGVKCPLIKVDECKGVTPPGGCCPICGGVVRVLYNKKSAIEIAQTARLPPITVQNITTSLQHQITTLECEPFTYMSIEDEIVIVVVPITQNPTPLQVEACNQEAQRISSLIELSSPTLTLDVSLAPLLAAEVQTTYVKTASSASSVYMSSTHLFHLSFVIMLFYVVINR